MDNSEKNMSRMKVLINLCLLIIIILLCIMGYAMFNLIQINQVVGIQSKRIRSLELDGLHYQAAMDYYRQQVSQDDLSDENRKTNTQMDSTLSLLSIPDSNS